MEEAAAIPAFHLQHYPHDVPLAAAEQVESWLRALDNLFIPGELNLFGGEPPRDTLPGRLATESFWHGGEDAQRPAYTPAMFHYLEHHAGLGSFAALEEYMRLWVSALHAARADWRSARDILFLFLQQSLEYLKDLYILGLPCNREVEANDAAILACLNRNGNDSLVAWPKFSRWVLEDWLPPHVRYYHRLNQEAGRSGGEE